MRSSRCARRSCGSESAPRSRRAGIPLVDTLPKLRASLAAGHNPYRSDWNGHPIAGGNAAIAEAVLESGVLDATSPAREPEAARALAP